MVLLLVIRLFFSLLLLLLLVGCLHQFSLCLEQVLRRLLLLHLNVQEDNDARNVVHDAFFFPLPSQVRFPHHSFCRFLGILCVEEGLHDLGYILVLQEFPHTVTRKHDEFVIFAQVELQNFYIKVALLWIQTYLARMSHQPSKRLHRQMSVSLPTLGCLRSSTTRGVVRSAACSSLWNCQHVPRIV